MRAYYKNGRAAPRRLHRTAFLQKINPGYFCVSTPGGYTNVGLGMRSDHISKRQANAGRVAGHHQYPLRLRERFKNAELEGKITGFGLPLGSKKRPISGDHFMLVGDAGHLIDPLSGEGIGNAIYSGYIAAEQVQECLAKNDFSASFMKAYDERSSSGQRNAAELRRKR
ncbi:MAG: hypothetical protein R2825_18910 [Saprospiraceae bacterium]